MPLPTLTASRYVQPLREGGSLPAVVDTEEDGLYVVKFRGAGQGPKVLLAELLAGRLAAAAGLDTPGLALVRVPPPFGRNEPDPEIRDLLRASHGLNVGVRYLDGAFNFDATAAAELVTPDFASRLVWFDAWLTNPDRTARNPNLMVWRRRLWLIDHGAALYAHHDRASVDEARMRAPFPLIRHHLLLAAAAGLEAADRELAPAVEAAVAGAVADLPDDLLEAAEPAVPPAAQREWYRQYLRTRLEPPRAFLAEALAAREQALREPPRRLETRR